MTQDRWQRVQALFEEALAQPPESRDSYLEAICGDDLSLRTEVESLLRTYETVPDSFMQPASPGVNADGNRIPEDVERFIGRKVGEYQVTRVIASGGMGAVYLASQQNPHRDVALKVMRAGFLSCSALRRFEYESQILAHLHHPCIAQVYAAGTYVESRDSDRSIPYFAMEYVPEAQSITDYATDRALNTRERLSLFLDVCAAVHHGHQKGVIHRDLKPGNILVDRAGHVKVIDFGVARATDSDIALTTVQTDIGQILGTLQYMSPEQCGGDANALDMRSDVYSLGVVLYELLSGQLPYDLTGTTIIGAAKVICELPPTHPSAFTRDVRGDLEIILLKALEKDRENRYQAAIDLSHDIRRYLNGEPIEAKPPTTWVRGARWVSRHPVTTTTVGCVSVAAIIVTTTWFLIWLANARPYEMVVAEDNRVARVLSVSGGTLASWKAAAQGGIVFADLLDGASTRDGGKVALVGYGRGQAHRHRGFLCAFDLDMDVHEPIWIGRIKTEELPAELRVNRSLVGQGFGISRGWTFDIFDQPPGKEIVAIHQHDMWSYCAIRIYDRDGRILYEVWHDGAIGSCYWMSGAKLLVFSGSNSEADWSRRGYPAVNSSPDPRVVFAIRPERGLVARSLICSTSCDREPQPAWYRCLLPHDAVEYLTGWMLDEPWGVHDPGKSVEFSLRFRDDGKASVSWVIDEFGTAVPGTRVTDDLYRREVRHKRLPPSSDFELAPLPLIMSIPSSEPNGFSP